MIVHAIRRIPGFTWCGMRAEEVWWTPWASLVTCGECIELVVQERPELAGLYHQSPTDALVSAPLPAQRAGGEG